MSDSVLNPYFRRPDVIFREIKELVESGQTIAMVMPFDFQLPDGSWWTLPFEPLVTVSMANVIVRRNVAKSAARGTIKERWAEDDMKITLEGTFVNEDPTKYPDVYVQHLRSVITQRRAIGVRNELLQLLGVDYIVVESCELPFSKGENVQNYSISALSDDSYNLFIEVK